MKSTKCILRFAALHQRHTVASHSVGMELPGVCVQRTAKLKQRANYDRRDKNENRRSELKARSSPDAILGEILTAFVRR